MLLVIAWPYRKITVRPPELSLKHVLMPTLFLIFCCVFMFLALMSQIRQGDFAWAGHGPGKYAYLHLLWQQQNLAHFPIIGTHYDELIFHYFLMSPLKLTFNPILAWWTTLAFSKLSTFVFFIFLFRKLNISAPIAWVFSLYLHIGTIALDPNKYYLLFDTLNPLFFVATTSRVVGIALIIFLMLNIISFKQTSYLPAMFFILSGLGLSATSISNGLWAIIILLLAYIFKAYYSGSDIRDFKPASLISYGCVLGALCLYALPFSDPYYLIRSLLVLGIVLLYVGRFIPIIIGGIYTLQSNGWWPTFYKTLLFLLTVAAGLVFFGNVIANNSIALDLWAALSRAFGHIEFQNIPLRAGVEFEPQTGTFAVGDYRELADWTYYCRSLVFFCAHYGGFLIMILTLNILSKKAKPDSIVCARSFFEMTIVMSVGFVFVLFFMDFVDFGTRAWLKSRFLEPPVYLIIFTLLVALYRKFETRGRLILAVILVLYSVIPFFATKRDFQIIGNYKYFSALKSEWF